MIQKIFPLLIFFLFFFSLATTPVLSQTTLKWEDQTTSSGQKCVLRGDVATIQGLECLFYNVLQVIVYIAGLAFIFMFISGGFQYLTSAGDPKATAQSSSTLAMAILGLVGIILSWLILKFIQDFTGVNVTEFKIPPKP